MCAVHVASTQQPELHTVWVAAEFHGAWAALSVHLHTVSCLRSLHYFWSRAN